MKYLALLAIFPGLVFGALDAKAKAKGNRYFGTATDQNTFSNSNVANIIRTEFGVVTPENSMKWNVIQPNRGQFSWGQADALVNFATQNNKQIRGHTLVWHSQLAEWVKQIRDRATLEQVITTHINTVMGRYKGKIFHWDVVNEVFEENGTFRNSVFYQVMREDFIDFAFRAARNADPAAKLYINDYNLDGPGAKIDAMLALINRLKARGTPIDGVGTQAHLILGQVGGVKSQLERLAATGLDVAITELDIRIPNPVDNNKRQRQQGDYQTVVKACVDVPKCVGVTVWGVSDRNSWVDSTFPSYDAPLLFDDNYQKKPAYNGADAALN